MVHSDCFAYKAENEKACCNALKILDCMGCNFYKTVEQAAIDRAKYAAKQNKDEQ